MTHNGFSFETNKHFVVYRDKIKRESKRVRKEGREGNFVCIVYSLTLS